MSPQDLKALLYYFTIVNSVLMDSPHVVNALVDLLVVVVLAQHLRSDYPEEYVLELQFEERCQLLLSF